MTTKDDTSIIFKENDDCRGGCLGFVDGVRGDLKHKKYNNVLHNTTKL